MDTVYNYAARCLNGILQKKGQCRTEGELFEVVAAFLRNYPDMVVTVSKQVKPWAQEY